MLFFLLFLCTYYLNEAMHFECFFSHYLRTTAKINSDYKKINSELFFKCNQIFRGKAGEQLVDYSILFIRQSYYYPSNAMIKIVNSMYFLYVLLILYLF